MQITQAVNKGKNLLATAIIALAGFAFLPEMFVEDEFTHKLDDGLLFILAIIAISWYFRGDNRFKRSVVPVVLVIFGLLVKILAVILELKDAADIGDDIGGLILFVLASILVVWQYRKKDEVALPASNAV